MAKFRKKPEEIEGTQWLKVGDHPAVRPWRARPTGGGVACGQCGELFRLHGWLETQAGGHVVCPGDWIIRKIRGLFDRGSWHKGDFEACRPEVLQATYEAIEED